MDLRDRLSIEHRVVQAPLGGGIARAELAAAVSRAGGLGTVGTLLDVHEFRRELRRCKELCERRPFAANLLLPALRPGHVEACVAEKVPVVSLFFGFDRAVVSALHGAGALVVHQIGSVDQARRALDDGADVLVAQGAGAGGHVLAQAPLEQLLPALRDLAGNRPLLASGGIHDRASAERAVALGADGVWAGTRFLLTPESHAHDAYKARLLEARETLETHLFGFGWHALHRVVPNAATRRWCRGDPLGPIWVRRLQRATEWTARYTSAGAALQLVAAQRVSVPLFSPVALLRGMPAEAAEVTPLYAGQAVAQIRALRSAADVTRELSV
jgi:NAD(P)H-dependent flavin oxidoreductase YrpB (nitropropane dioxygenase family)